MKKSCLAFLIIMLTLAQAVLLTGCWSSKEVERLAISTVVGFDYRQANGSGEWTVSTRILNPGTRGEGDTKSGGTGGQEKLLVGKGRTLQEAILDLTAHSSRSPFYGHSNSLVVGEQAAREKMSELIEGSMRFWQVIPTYLVAVTKGTALQVLQTGASVDNLLSSELKDLSDYKTAATGYSYGVIMNDFAGWLVSPDRDPVATLVNVVPPDLPGSRRQNLMEGLAVFRADKLVGWLNREETRGYLLVTQKISKGPMPIPVKMNTKLITYFLGASKSKIEPLVTGDKIAYRVTIKTLGEIDENAGIELGADNLKVVEGAISNTLKELSMLAVDKAREFDADFLGFSEQLHRHNLEAWEKLGTSWRESFREADVEIVVDDMVVRTGKIGKKLDIKDK